MASDTTTPSAASTPALKAFPLPEVEPYELMAQVGREVAEAMSSALERVNTLTATGRIERSSLRALREEIERARRTGILGQQVSRVASGRIRMVDEALDLTALLREALSQRSREVASRGLEIQQVLNPATVTSDATLLFSLLQAVLDWCFEHASSRVELHVEVKTWPAQAQLHAGFVFRDGDTPEQPAARLASMSWRLIERCAQVLGLILEREDHPKRTKLVIAFPQTVMTSQTMDTLLDLGHDTDAAHTLSGNSKPLVGSHVLVVTNQREVRAHVRDILRTMGLMLDFVSTVDEARVFCAGGMPHAIVYEASLGGGHMQRLVAELMQDTPSLALIEVAEGGRPFEVMNLHGRERSRVSKLALAEALPKALIFELARGR
jgi:hypothetical protein